MLRTGDLIKITGTGDDHTWVLHGNTTSTGDILKIASWNGEKGDAFNIKNKQLCYIHCNHEFEVVAIGNIPDQENKLLKWLRS